jgi:O-methyltransferase
MIIFLKKLTNFIKNIILINLRLIKNFFINGKSDFQFIDLHIFSPFLKNSKESIDYKRSLIMTNMTWSDNVYKRLRFYSLHQHICRVCNDKNLLKYNFAECGVWYGHSAHMISKILKKHNFKKSFFLFDSFEGGLSDKSSNDKNLIKKLSVNETIKEKNIFTSTEAEVTNNLKEFKFIKIFPGWIPDSFPDTQKLKFSFVHIDVDLYEPTLESLKYFWPKLTKNGVIVIDDYSSSQFDGATKAVDTFLKSISPSFFYKVPMGSCFIIK